MQEALLQGYRAYGGLKDEAAGGPWLKAILVNVFRDDLRKRGGASRRSPPCISRISRSSGLWSTRIRCRTRTRCTRISSVRSGAKTCVKLLRMPEIYRAPLVLRYMDGFSTKEIARLLDAPLGTIRPVSTEGGTSSSERCGPTPGRRT